MCNVYIITTLLTEGENKIIILYPARGLRTCGFIGHF